MKYTISEYNRWTTLSAVVDNHLFGVYTTPFNVISNSWMVCGEYPQSEQPKILNHVVMTIKPDKHMKPEELNALAYEFQDLEMQNTQDYIINAMQESIHNYYFGDAKEQEWELHFRIRRSLDDMYEDGYIDGKHKRKHDLDLLQGKFDWILEAVMEYMRAAINNRNGDC